MLDAGSPSADSGAAPDGGVAADAESDAGLPDSGPAGLQNPRALAPAETWSPPGPWLVTGEVPGADRLARGFLERSFAFPASAGTTPEGVSWTEQQPDENGAFFVFGQRTVYAALVVETAEPLSLLVRLREFELLIDNTTLHDPDPYRTNRVIHPVHLSPGRHTLVFRGSNQREQPSVRFERVDAPVFPNLQDVTFPDLVPGEARAQPLGVHAVNLSGAALSGLRAVVLEHPLFEATARAQPDLPRDALSTLTFDLVPRGALPDTVATATLTLGIQARETDALHTFEYALPIAPEDRGLRRTFVSGIDGSTQYYAVTGPETPPPTPGALFLSLHGAAVQARGQARSYGRKDWAWVVAPTNRRPFGFDWQDWGRLDAMEVLAEAQRTLPIDPLQVYLTGHSMGGHGSWHLGALYPDRFAGVAPSAGWISFETYGGSPSLPAAWDAGRLHDDTLAYKQNFADRAVYIIHGTDDNNVPVTQARTMFQELQGLPSDLLIHEEPGAGHWWDRDPAPGARCVDFAEMFELFRMRRRVDPELEFQFVSPSPWINPGRSFVRVEAAEDPYRSFELRAARTGALSIVSTDNVAALIIDAAPLHAAGIREVDVDGELRSVPESGELRFGTAEKRPGRHGPLKEVFFNPFCFIHDDGDAVGAAVASNLTGIWAVIGNGAACTLPFSRREEAGDRNRIYLGIPSERLALPSDIPFVWTSEAVVLAGEALGRPTFLGVTFPEGDHLAASLFGTAGAEWLMTFIQPFSSRSAFPDWFTFVLNDEGNPAYGPAGWFDANWSYDPQLRR